MWGSGNMNTIDPHQKELFDSVNEMRTLLALRAGADTDQLANTFEKVVMQMQLGATFGVFPSTPHGVVHMLPVEDPSSLQIPCTIIENVVLENVPTSVPVFVAATEAGPIFVPALEAGQVFVTATESGQVFVTSTDTGQVYVTSAVSSRESSGHFSTFTSAESSPHIHPIAPHPHLTPFILENGFSNMMLHQGVGIPGMPVGIPGMPGIVGIMPGIPRMGQANSSPALLPSVPLFSPGVPTECPPLGQQGEEAQPATSVDLMWEKW